MVEYLYSTPAVWAYRSEHMFMLAENPPTSICNIPVKEKMDPRLLDEVIGPMLKS